MKVDEILALVMMRPGAKNEALAVGLITKRGEDMEFHRFIPSVATAPKTGGDAVTEAFERIGLSEPPKIGNVQRIDIPEPITPLEFLEIMKQGVEAYGFGCIERLKWTKGGEG